jgi:predicted lysophospholipase L1 biosynthesis ABC-type transport system permease subunit
MHTLGWWWFSMAPWGWPPGASPLNGLELANGVGLSDSLPLFAFPFKLISQWMPERFQYWGHWELLCFVLQSLFAVLLITVLLTVSANQRLGEVAALRALGFSRRRVVADVLSESALIVGIGGGLSLPLGALLALWLDRILKQMPGVPADVHFFVYQPEAFTTHALLLMATAVVAALYPMYLVAGLPIATTLRNEVGA